MAKKARNKGPFPRTGKTRRKRRSDRVGTVRIRIALADPENSKGYLAGNRTKQFTVPRSKVSEVADLIDAAIFIDEEDEEEDDDE